MALLPIPNQPVSFNGSSIGVCDCVGQPFCQLAQMGDTLKFQIKMGSCGNDYVTDGMFASGMTFWTVSGGSWVYANGGAQHVIGTTGALSQTFAVQKKGWWKIDYTISKMNTGNVQASMAGSGSGQLNSSNGDFTDYIYDNAIVQNTPVFTPSADFNGVLSNIKAHFLFDDATDDLRMFIKDLNGNIVGEIAHAEFRTFDRGYMLYEIPWDNLDLSPGCYTICILDPCLNTNNQFDLNIVGNELFVEDQTGMVIQVTDNGTDDVSIDACIDEDAGEGDVSAPILVPGIKYQVDFTVLFNCDNIKLRPFAGTNDGEFITEDGTYSLLMEAAGNSSFGFHFESIGGDDGGCVEITDIQLSVDPSSYVFDLLSNCFNFRETQACTMLINWYNIEDAFGFIYPSGWKFEIRVEGKLWKPNFEKEKTQFKFADGRRKLLTSESEEKYRLTLAEIPAYMHEAISLGLDHDYFIIGEDHYIGDDTDYTPEWRNSSQLAPITFDVTKSLDPDLRNNNCA